MRLVILTPFLETQGGMERVVLKIAQHFDATVHTLYYDPENTFQEFKNLQVEVGKPSIIRKIPLAKRVTGAIEAGKYFYNLKLKDYDVVNAQQTPAEWARNFNAPMIWYSHTPNREAFDLYEWRMKRRNAFSKAIFWTSIQAFRYFEFRTVPKIEYIFTNSKNSQQRIKTYLKQESEVLYPGVEYEKFSSKRYENFFFYPSRIVPEKELEYAIEAFKLFSKRANGWKLIIAGGLSKRPEHQNYYKKIKALCNEDISVETNVTEERLVDLYATCNCVLYTPVNEDFGLVPLEALASGKPCIARNEGGPRETIIDKKDGFLVNSIFEMAERMEFLAKNPEQAEKMGSVGRTKVKKDFTWERFLKRFGEKAKELADGTNNQK
ncbi:glycosyltransferase family 4 protein [Candidatus Micrarchaeota archaeon]|nr:glycosyltransferase family 4 protein [Candidatus Micrarchaeota archaeon]